MLKLHYAPGTIALATAIALEEAGVPYEAVKIDFRANEQQSGKYLKVNPKGRVPSLVIDSGILTETPAILAYIAQASPEARLAPLGDPFAFAKVQEFNSYLCSTVHVAHAHRMRGKRWVDDAAAIVEMQRKVPETVTACFTLIENEMFKGPWVIGQNYTICDAYLFTVARWLESDSVDPKLFPKVFEHRNRMGERPTVRAAIARVEI